jgi:hypothetical protein
VVYFFPKKIVVMKSHTNTSLDCANLIKKCIVFKSGMIIFNLYNVFIEMKKKKFGSAYVDASIEGQCNT